MIPFILAVVGGYLIGESMKDSKKFADGGFTDKPKWNLKPDQYLKKTDWEDLAFVKEMYDKGNYDSAMNFASNLDTIVREEIPPEVWRELGGELTKKGLEEAEKNMKNSFADGGDIIVGGYPINKTIAKVKRGIKFFEEQPVRDQKHIDELKKYLAELEEQKKNSKFDDGGEVEGLDVYESVFLYVKRGLKQPFREDYLKPIGLYNTEKAKEVEESLKKKGYLNSAGSINELGKNKAKQINDSLNYAISDRYLGTSRSDRKEKFEKVKEKFVNYKK